MSSYGVLEETGNTLSVNEIEIDDFSVDIRAARKAFLKRGMRPYYAQICKSEGKDYVLMEDLPFGTLDELYQNFDETEIRDMPPKTKKKFSKELREKVVVLPDADHYFREHESETMKKTRKDIENFYNTLPKDMPWPEKNKKMLRAVAKEVGLPEILPQQINVYEVMDRPLEPEEFKDDMENRAFHKENLKG